MCAPLAPAPVRFPRGQFGTTARALSRAGKMRVVLESSTPAPSCCRMATAPPTSLRFAHRPAPRARTLLASALLFWLAADAGAVELRAPFPSLAPWGYYDAACRPT